MTTTSSTISTSDASVGEGTKHNAPKQHSQPVFIEESSDYFCTCNLNANKCDINCCCDMECTKSHRQLFTHCIPTFAQKSSEQCYSKNIMYSHNTEFIVEQSSSGLLCVVWDNVREKKVFRDQQVVKKKNDRKDVFSDEYDKWMTFKSVDEKLEFYPTTHINDPIWRVVPSTSKHDHEELWQLPWTTFHPDHLCNSLKTIHFLHDFESSCLRDISQLKTVCKENSFLDTTHYFKNLFIDNKHFAREKQAFSENETTSETNISEKKKPKCVASFECIEISVENETFPELTFENNRCSNVVQDVEYTVEYNASVGIIKIIVKFEFMHVHETQKYFRQHFSVKFIEGNRTLPRSGNPGYIFGKPVLALSLNSSKVDEFQISQFSKSIGFCTEHDADKRTVFFGLNLISGCTYAIVAPKEERANTCQAIQNEIMKIIKIDDKIDAIGIYGNSNASEKSDWLPILVDDEGINPHNIPIATRHKCPVLITGLSISIFYAFVGDVNQPQAKIISVIKKYTKTLRVPFRNDHIYSNRSIQLSISVYFHDITSSIETIAAPTPLFKIELPHDFFYPFFVNNTGENKPNLLSCFCCLIALNFLLKNQGINL
ncbi:tectonic-1-like protein [Dinothrombium tinctorium]|uniref:Tectonic-1-like protein n=1 Tax=Dinothrombium tinctorium TaxID=1965070 RepID=A0A443QNK7_9ACAR|nr:tectonic-1-like protein [Dinothrombium tinctorium]